MKKCKQCGAEVDASVKFCPNCGAKQSNMAFGTAALIVTITVLVCFTIFYVIPSQNREKDTHDAATWPGAVGASTQKPEEASAARAKSAGDLGDYYVEYKNAMVAEDYKGNPIIVITYAWTNNADKAKSAAVALSEKAFQDGVELDSAYFVMDNDIYDRNAAWRDVKPGSSIDVQCAFLLTSNSVVEFELSELFSLRNDTVSTNIEVSNALK